MVKVNILQDLIYLTINLVKKQIKTNYDGVSDEGLIQGYI